jgi:trans-aconitate 3-methyltransferase
VAAALSSRFARVHGSDASPQIIAQARLVFRDRPNLDFEVRRGEDVASAADPAARARAGSAECMPVLDTPAAMASFAALLRPGGTLAIWFYGGPIYLSPDGSADAATVARVQHSHRAITDRSMDEFRPWAGTHRQR